ncbi:MAG: hypothetical protein ACLQLH_17930 [Terracidiphilus sp.]
MRTMITLLLCMLLQNTYPAPGPGRNAVATSPISYTGNQCGASGGAGGVTNLACTLTVAHTGDTLVAFWSGTEAGSSYSSSTISCGTGSVPTDRSFTWGTNWTTFVVVVANASAGSCTFKVTVNEATYYTQLSVADFANANISAPLDNASCTTSPYCQNSGSSTSWSTNSITTSNPNEMLISYAGDGYSPTTVTENNGFTKISMSSYPIYYKLVSSKGTYSDSWTASSSGTWGAPMVALKH